MTAITAADGLATVGMVCFVLLLTPQVHLNYRRRSTAGMSRALVVLWMLSSVLFGGYLAFEGESPILVAQMSAFSCFGAVLLAQVALYGQGDGGGGGGIGVGGGAAAALGVLYVGVCAAGGVGFYFLCGATSDRSGLEWVPPAMGGWVPTALIVAGFAPQVLEFHRTQRSDGFSTLLSCIDLVGASCSLAAVVLHGFDAAAASLYASIVVCQVMMLALSRFVYPKSGAARRAAGDGGSGGHKRLADEDDDDALQRPLVVA